MMTDRLPRILTFALTFSLCVSQRAEGQRVDEWAGVPDLRIGSVDDPEYALSEPLSLAVAPDGTMYVSQTQEGIRIYDSEGQYVRTLGGWGGGPGEFRSVGRMGWSEDSLWVADPAQGRITLFPPEGRPRTVGSDGGTPVAGGWPAPPGALLRGGRVVLDPIPAAGLAAGEAPLSVQVREGGGLAEITMLAVGGRSKRIRGDRTAMTFRLPVTSYDLWEPAPDGSSLVVVRRPVAGDSERARFRVERFHGDGRLLGRREYSYPPRRIEAAARDSIEDIALGAVRRNPLGRDAGLERMLLDSLAIPPYEPPVTDLVVGRDGTIWLRREVLGRSTARWLVLDEDGRMTASVELPVGLDVLQAQRNAVWGVVEDELDVPYLVRYRIGPAGARSGGG